MTGQATNVQGYSFYLNVVVINTSGGDAAANSSDEKEVVKEPTKLEPEAAVPNGDDAPAEETQPVAAEEGTATTTPETNNDGDGNAVIAVSPATDAKVDPKIKLLMGGQSLVDSVFNKNRRNKRASSNEGSKIVKDGQRFMSKVGSSISRSGSNISKRASRYMANKTMVGRAEKAVGECIPLVTEEIGVEMSISKRFQQGPVFVLEVDIKGCDLFDLVEKMLGEESAQQYRNVKEGLEALDLPDTQEAFLKEMLPKLRKAMMDKMSEIVPEKMKLKKQYADLEIQCVALEDAEEAKWLYNFLAFMEEMK